MSADPDVLASLAASEKAAVLDRLLERHPDLREQAERLADELLRDVSSDVVAEDVAWSLESLRAEELNDRAGKQPWGYVEPTEAAWEVLEEAAESWLEEIERLGGLGMRDAARATAVGVVAGLYRCRGVDDGEALLSWAEDFPAEQAVATLERLRKAGVTPPLDEVAALAPEWEGRLRRRLGG